MILVILKRNGIWDPKGSFYLNCISPTKIEKAISWCINSTSNSTYTQKESDAGTHYYCTPPGILKPLLCSLLISYFKADFFFPQKKCKDMQICLYKLSINIFLQVTEFQITPITTRKHQLSTAYAKYGRLPPQSFHCYSGPHSFQSHYPSCYFKAISPRHQHQSVSRNSRNFRCKKSY